MLAALAVCVGAPRHAAAESAARPPPVNVEYLQYGFSVQSLTVSSAGEICPEHAETPCIIGPGGGLGLRAGYRARGALYFGAVYELSRLDSSNQLRLAVLQQLLGEMRVYFDQGTRLTPYLRGAAGGTLYGNEFGAATGGLAFGLGVGVEYQVTATTVIGLAPSYQPLALRRFTDATGLARGDGPLGFGVVHFVSIELLLELRDPLVRW